jgi:DNA-binding response OmpR family regulator/predicted regulator of Ras-like GTPase activity (Roadblock/LC7/MglB family)
MSDVSRIFVVEGDEGLNRNLVNTLRKDGYRVQGVMSGTDAVRTLWAEEYDVVICDVKTPGADGFEVLQWLRAYRPNARMILMGGPATEAVRTQALENGASSYLEKPLDLRLLKEELRRLVQKTGFSASLDSFDLLDVIQIVNMSRKNIALLINTGLEERGILRFQNGELIWAEYGMLQGEEAFFALAAHKNGTVLHQPWNGQVVSNVTQPLSRLIFQALQYRTKYAHLQQYSGEMAPVSSSPLLDDDGDEDRPFVFSTEEETTLPPPSEQPLAGQPVEIPPIVQPLQPAAMNQAIDNKEWWEQTGSFRASSLQNGEMSDSGLRPAFNGMPSGVFPLESLNAGESISAPTPELPGWLTDQPTSGMAPIRPMTPSSANIAAASMMPPTPVLAETEDIRSMSGSGVMPALPPMPPSPERQTPSINGTSARNGVSSDTGVLRPSAPDWQENSGPVRMTTTGLQNIPPGMAPKGRTGSMPALTESGSLQAPTTTGGLQRVTRYQYNYSALVSALQTLGYSVAGFVAAAVVNADGQPVAQVAIEDLDIMRVCRQFSAVLKNVDQSLKQERWGVYEHMIITSSDRYILMRLVGGEKRAFQVLITTRDTDPMRSLEMMANVEGAITTALQ